MANIKEAFQYASQNPTSDFANNLKQLASSGALDVEAQKNGIDLSAFKPAPEGATGLAGFSQGVAKGELSTLKGIGQLGEKIGGAFLPDSITPKSVYSEQALQQDAAQGGKVGQILNDKSLTPITPSEKIGKLAEQTAEWFIPSGKVGQVEKLLSTNTGVTLIEKLTPIIGEKGANIVAKAGEVGTKAVVRAGEGGGVVALQTGGDPKQIGTAAGLSAAIPVAGAVVSAVASPFKALAGRLVENLSSGLSGVPGESLNLIKNNASTAKSTVNAINQGGQESVLQNNANTIMNGVSKIRKEASASFGAGLESLKSVDIKPDVIKSEIKSVIESNGGKLSSKGFNLADAEFSADPKLVTKANDLVNAINTQKDLSGKGIRSLMNLIESKRLKTATSDVSISYNRFIDELSSGLKKSILKSTDKLNEINKAYSNDMSLVGGIEKIFGKVNFKNTEELNTVANKLETMFSEKGLDPKTINDFLTRIGVSPSEFRTSEATRQIGNITTKGNSEGISVGELIRSVSSAAVTPKAIRDAAIFTGLAEQQIQPILEKLSPAARASFIELFARNKQSSQ